MYLRKSEHSVHIGHFSMTNTRHGHFPLTSQGPNEHHLLDGKVGPDNVPHTSPKRPTLCLVDESSSQHSQPANIRLMHYVVDGPIQLKVLDFGIAKEIGQEKGQLTTTGAIMGTPLYLAPELLSETHSEIDGRIDQYSAGVVLYQLLAGCPPFAGQNVAAILLSHVATPPPPLPKTVPESLQRVVLRMLKKTAKERFPHDEALLIALKECVPACRSAQTARRGAIRPSSASLIISLPIQTQRRQNALFGLLFGVFVVGTAVLAVLIQRRPNPQSTQTVPAISAAKSAAPSSASAHTPVIAEAPNQSPRSSTTAAIDRALAKSLPTSSTEVRKDAALKKPKQKVRSGQRIEQKEDPFAVPLAR